MLGIVDTGIDRDEGARTNVDDVTVRPVERHRRGIRGTQACYHAPSRSAGIPKWRSALTSGMTVTIGFVFAKCTSDSTVWYSARRSRCLIVGKIRANSPAAYCLSAWAGEIQRPSSVS